MFEGQTVHGGGKGATLWHLCLYFVRSGRLILTETSDFLFEIKQLLIAILIIYAGRWGFTLQYRILFYIPNYTSLRTLLSKCKLTSYFAVSCCAVHETQLTYRPPFCLFLCIFFFNFSNRILPVVDKRPIGREFWGLFGFSGVWCNACFTFFYPFPPKTVVFIRNI